MKNLNLILKHPMALTIAKIAIVLFLIDFVKKVFGISQSTPVDHAAAYSLGFAMGAIANIAVKIFGSIVILRILFTTESFSSKKYSKG